MSISRSENELSVQTPERINLGIDREITLSNTDLVVVKQPIEERLGRMANIRRKFGFMNLPGSTIERKINETTYLLVSSDLIMDLERQVLEYKGKMIAYQARIEEAIQARKISPSMINTEYKRRKRRPLVIQDLEEQRNSEIDTVNAAKLRHPKIPALINPNGSPPRIIVLNGVDGVCVKITLENTKELRYDKDKIGIVIQRLSESREILFNSTPMAPGEAQSRALDKKNPIAIGLGGKQLLVSGLNNKKISLTLSNSK